MTLNCLNNLKVKRLHHPIPGNRNNAANYFDETNGDTREKRVSRDVSNQEELDPLKFKKYRVTAPKTLPTPPKPPPHPLAAKRRNTYKIVEAAIDYGIRNGVVRPCKNKNFFEIIPIGNTNQSNSLSNCSIKLSKEEGSHPKKTDSPWNSRYNLRKRVP